MVSKSRNKILASWEPPFCRTLYYKNFVEKSVEISTKLLNWPPPHRNWKKLHLPLCPRPLKLSCLLFSVKFHHIRLHWPQLISNEGKLISNEMSLFSHESLWKISIWSLTEGGRACLFARDCQNCEWQSRQSSLGQTRPWIAVGISREFQDLYVLTGFLKIPDCRIEIWDNAMKVF